MQRIANPWTSVRLRDAPPFDDSATLAQLVERNLAKVEVTSSNLVCRYNLSNNAKRIAEEHGALAEWLCSGLQIRVPRFDSGTRLHSL